MLEEGEEDDDDDFEDCEDADEGMLNIDGQQWRNRYSEQALCPKVD